MQKGFDNYKKGDNRAAVFHFTRAARFFGQKKAKITGQNFNVDKFLECESGIRLAHSFRAEAYSKLGDETRAKISRELADRLID